MSAFSAMVRSEATLLARNPAVVIWTAVLPVAAAIVLGVVPGTSRPSDDLGGLSFFSVYQPVLVLFAVTLLAVQALPDVLTRYRELGVLKRLRTTPASPALLLFVQLLLLAATSLVCAALMVVVPGVLGASWPRQPVGFVLALLLVVWAMLGLGTLIAALFRNAKVAAGVGTLLFFVLQFFAGLWIQRPLMPGWLRTISDLTASGAGAQSLMDAAAGGWPSWTALLVLVVWGAAASLLAVRLFTWE